MFISVPANLDHSFCRLIAALLKFNKDNEGGLSCFPGYQKLSWMVIFVKNCWADANNASVQQFTGNTAPVTYPYSSITDVLGNCTQHTLPEFVYVWQLQEIQIRWSMVTFLWTYCIVANCHSSLKSGYVTLGMLSCDFKYQHNFTRYRVTGGSLEMRKHSNPDPPLERSLKRHKCIHECPGKTWQEQWNGHF